MMERSIKSMRLGRFLRTRRERLSPSDFGLPLFGRRRTPGLRREEVAQLSGISIAYYTWIEQGRNLRLSSEVLNALADTLRLTNAERTHLFTLAVLDAPHNAAAPDGAIHPTIAHLFASRSAVCAVDYDRWFNAVAATPLATALFGITADAGNASNLLYHLFEDLGQRSLWADWDSEARMLVGMFQQALAKWPGVAESEALLGTMMQFPDFERFWEAYDVRLPPCPDEYFREEPWELRHPKVGSLHIHRIAMSTRNEQTLAIYSPADGDTSAKFTQLSEAKSWVHSVTA